MDGNLICVLLPNTFNRDAKHTSSVIFRTFIWCFISITSQYPTRQFSYYKIANDKLFIQAESPLTGVLHVHSYVDLPGYSAMMGTLFRDPKEGEPGVQTIPLTKIVCGPSESQLVMLQLE